MKLKAFCKKHKTFVRYTIFGMGTTIVNLCIYYALSFAFGHTLYQLWNAIAWFFSVLYSFFVNEKYVFKNSKDNELKKFFEFTGGRFFSLIVEAGILFVFITLLSCNDKVVKLFSNIIVVVINYFFCKKIVFKK